MKFYYDNDGTIEWLPELYHYDPCYTYAAPMFSEAAAAVDDAACWQVGQDSLGLKRDWSAYKLLKLTYYGDWGNVQQQMYVGLQDGDGTFVSVINPDPHATIGKGWHTWYIRLKDFNGINPGLNLADVARIYIGVGNRAAPVTGGRGTIFIDDIQLLTYSVCVPGNLSGDFTGDCMVNASDLQRMKELWLGEPPSLPTPVIRLDAAALPLGTLSNWTNTGTAGGNFVDFNSPQTGYRPIVSMVDNVKAVLFDGNDIMTADINTPASITGSNPFTVVYTVWNEVIDNSEAVFSWAKRGGTLEKSANVYYGSDGPTHWGPIIDFIPFPGWYRGIPAAHTWHTIAVTYEGGTNGKLAVIVDGHLDLEWNKTLNIWPNCYMFVGGGCGGDPYLLPREKMDPGLFFSGATCQIRSL